MYSQGNEIVTLALGHYSSHIVTHYYNVQEASFSYNPNFKTGINHDALFRESSHLSQTRYTPRLVIADDRDALGFLSKDGYYKTSEETEIGNNSDVEVIVKEDLWGKNQFLADYSKEKERQKEASSLNNVLLLKNSYDLEDVTSWSDYLVAECNDRTIVSLPRNTDYYDNYDQFSNFQSGISLWNKSSLGCEIEERTRFFMEEVDNAQGFQVIYDGDNGYSGISAGCLEMLRDEYNKKSILAIPVIYADIIESSNVQTQYRKRCEKIYSLSSGLSLSSQFCDIVAPMSHIFNPWDKNPNVRIFKNLEYKHHLMYHTGAILAAALDLFTLPYRLQTATSLSDLATAMTVYGRNVAAVGFMLPVPVKPGEDIYLSLEEVTGNFFSSLTPLIEIDHQNVDIQSISSKGLVKPQINPKPESAEEFLKVFFHKKFSRVISSLNLCKSSFRVPRTFPRIIDERFNLSVADNCYGPLAEFAALGGLHNCKEVGNVLNTLYKDAKSIKINRIPGFGPRDSEVDYGELFEDLKNLSLKYSDISYL